MNIYYHLRKNLLGLCEILLKNHNLFYDFVESKKEMNFVQIGANDGVQADNINQYISSKWTGCLIEPIPFYYDKLVQQYCDYSANLKFFNCAISNSDGSMDIYYLNPDVLDDLPLWCHGLGTFNKDRLINQVEGFFEQRSHLEKYIIKTQVPVYTFEQFAKKNEIYMIDLLAMDTEGHDYIILNSIDFKTIKVSVILFEFKHMKLREIAKLYMKFSFNGYRVRFHSADDMIAVERKSLKRN